MDHALNWNPYLKTYRFCTTTIQNGHVIWPYILPPKQTGHMNLIFLHKVLRVLDAVPLNVCGEVNTTVHPLTFHFMAANNWTDDSDNDE